MYVTLEKCSFRRHMSFKSIPILRKKEGKGSLTPHVVLVTDILLSHYSCFLPGVVLNESAMRTRGSRQIYKEIYPIIKRRMSPYGNTTLNVPKKS